MNIHDFSRRYLISHIVDNIDLEDYQTGYKKKDR